MKLTLHIRQLNVVFLLNCVQLPLYCLRRFPSFSSGCEHNFWNTIYSWASSLLVTDSCGKGNVFVKESKCLIKRKRQTNRHRSRLPITKTTVNGQDLKVRNTFFYQKHWDTWRYMGADKHYTIRQTSRVRYLLRNTNSLVKWLALLFFYKIMYGKPFLVVGIQH